MRVAVTGASGRLGSALVTAFGRHGGTEVAGWSRREFDLDDPSLVRERIGAGSPELVVHAAAWTDVDECARQPELAIARNGDATRVLAEACIAAGCSLILVSTNEVFDGERVDGRGYEPSDPARPPNAYGRSKLAGEQGAIAAYGPRSERIRGDASLGIVRTAWLFGRGKPDFPARIAEAAIKAGAEGLALRVVADEIGTPTYTPDLAEAIARLAGGAFEGVHHVVNDGLASRADWARDVLERLEIKVPIEEISLADYQRPSRPPRWGVLAATPIPGGPLRAWRDSMADRAEDLAGTMTLR